MSSSNVAIVPEYLDTGGGSVNNIVITGINGIIVTEPTPGNFEISMTPLTVVGGTGITVTEPTPNNYSIASTVSVTAGAGITVSSPTPGNFQVVSNVGITGQDGVIVTQPTPSNYVIVRDPRVEVWFSQNAGPFNLNPLPGGGSATNVGPLNLTGLPFINLDYPITIAIVMCGTTSNAQNPNELTIGLYDAGNNFLTGFNTTSMIPTVNWGTTIPSQDNFVSSFVVTSLPVLQTAYIGAFLHYPPLQIGVNDLQVQVIIQFTI